MTLRLSLRGRLGLGAALLALLAVAASALAVYGLARTQAEARLAMAAQRRIEAYAAHSARVNDWMLGWLLQDRGAPDPTPVLTTLEVLDRLLAEDVSAVAEPGQRTSLAPGRLRGAFQQLHRVLIATPPGTPEGDAAIAFYGAQTPQLVLQQIDLETRRRDAALISMEALRRPLLTGALAIAIAAPLVLAGLYLFLLRPLFQRLSQASARAAELAQGRSAFAGAGAAAAPLPKVHDELGLFFARLRLVSARLERQRQHLAGAHERLEATVAERTAALTEANQRLARTDDARRRFFADVGHELRTPLTVILGEAELGSSHPDPAVRSAFETVRNRSLRLFRRIEDLLRIARSDSGQLELHPEPVALGEVLDLAQADLAPVLRRAGVSARVDVPPLWVEADADWLRQVFAGLLENSAKYAGRGAEVTIRARATEGQAEIDITDTGPGLPPEGDDLFDRFARRGAAAGFGVGLAMARWVAEALGGRLDPVSAASGLHLRLVLPLAEEA